MRRLLIVALSVVVLWPTLAGMWGRREVLLDASLYYYAHLGDLYATSTSAPITGYQSPPVLAQALSIFRFLPYPLFHVGMEGLNIVALIAMVGLPLAALSLIPFEPVNHAVQTGNVFLLMSFAVVIGLRRPWAWALPILTKVTPGVCLTWYVGRREWRSLGVALAVTGVIAGVSFLISPADWFAWAHLMKANAVSPAPDFSILPWPLIVRLPVAALVAGVAGRLNAPWVLIVALVFAQPYVGFTTLAMLVAIIPALRLTLGRDLGVGQVAPTTWIPTAAGAR